MSVVNLMYFIFLIAMEPFKCYVTHIGGGGKRYEGVRFNVIRRYEGVGVQFPKKKRYVTLECPLCVLLPFYFGHVSSSS